MNKVLKLCVFTAFAYIITVLVTFMTIDKEGNFLSGCDFLGSSVANAGGTCGGSFINPITDVCWDCMFPLRLAGVKIQSGKQVDTPSPTNKPLCLCKDPLPRAGIPIEFWEPVRLIDVTKKPYCFPNLGGITIDAGLAAPSGRQDRQSQGQRSFAQVHYYIYPLMTWLELIVDFACLESSGFDVSYITELDPLWNDDQLTFTLNPEAVLFANPVAEAAGIADCVATTAGLPLDPIFWMAGCQGSMYPLNGSISAENTTLQSHLLTAEKFVYKLHRQGVAWGYLKGLCGKYPMPIMQKSQYRFQLVNPVPTVSGKYGCSPTGRSTLWYESYKEIPIIGEDFGFLLWRKRACCAF